jgi:hypothetical protein
LRFKFEEVEQSGLLGIKLTIKSNQAYATGLPKMKIDINIFHKQLGHPFENVTKQTGKLLCMQLTGTMEACSECAMAKTKSKATKKASLN